LNVQEKILRAFCLLAVRGVQKMAGVVIMIIDYSFVRISRTGIFPFVEGHCRRAAVSDLRPSGHLGWCIKGKSIVYQNARLLEGLGGISSSANEKNTPY